MKTRIFAFPLENFQKNSSIVISYRVIRMRERSGYTQKVNPIYGQQ